MCELLSFALSYAARGWSIIPVARAGKGKQPALRNWRRYRNERAAVEQLTQWCGRDDLAGIAVVCGPISGGVVIRDFDDTAAYKSWADAHPDLAARLPTVKTGRGFHVYFRSGLNRIIKCRDGELRGRGYRSSPNSSVNVAV
jgi:hypothetical protein